MTGRWLWCSVDAIRTLPRLRPALDDRRPHPSFLDRRRSNRRSLVARRSFEDRRPTAATAVVRCTGSAPTRSGATCCSERFYGARYSLDDRRRRRRRRGAHRLGDRRRFGLLREIRRRGPHADRRHHARHFRRCCLPCRSRLRSGPGCRRGDRHDRRLVAALCAVDARSGASMCCRATISRRPLPGGRRTRGFCIKHVLPLSWTPTIVSATMDFGQVVLLAASLSFIGLGVKPPDARMGIDDLRRRGAILFLVDRLRPRHGHPYHRPRFQFHRRLASRPPGPEGG